MKLRNKKTGEIVSLSIFGITINSRTEKQPVYRSIAELAEEWEDYEEPKEYWYIDTFGKCDISAETIGEYENIEAFAKEIGNYFETQEEAEKAVEKLKAWKRLKDKGFRFIDHIDRDSGQGMTRYEWNGYINGEDLDLLFGGEE